jgi:hypothetical protein
MMSEPRSANLLSPSKGDETHPINFTQEHIFPSPRRQRATRDIFRPEKRLVEKSSRIRSDVCVAAAVVQSSRAKDRRGRDSGGVDLSIADRASSCGMDYRRVVG